MVYATKIGNRAAIVEALVRHAKMEEESKQTFFEIDVDPQEADDDSILTGKLPQVDNQDVVVPHTPLERADTEIVGVSEFS